MARMQEGDQAAYHQFLEEVGPILYHFVKKRVFRRDFVEDVYQEVLLTFHKARHSYEPGRPLGPWLFTVARNSLLTALARNRKFVEREVPTEKLPDISPKELDLSLEDDLQEALKGLPPLYRNAVELLKIRGLSLEEAAKELNVSVGAVKVRAHRGYNQLRKKLLGDRKK
jgi:RNA polymerase sigma factor (sigma-70 family)